MSVGYQKYILVKGDIVGECLQKALKDSRGVDMIKVLVLILMEYITVFLKLTYLGLERLLVV